MVRLFIVCICLLFSLTSHAQQHWKTRGQISVYSDHYGFKAKNDSTLTGRRPNNFTRFAITPFFTYKKELKIPVTLIFSANQTNTLTPSSSEASFTSFLYNPANIIRIAPSYKWATLQLSLIHI